jgi:large subunit ribosomal protein L18
LHKMKKIKVERRIRRKGRIRAKVFGTGKRPRLSVFRSNVHIYGQIIDDEKGETLVSFGDINLKKQAKMRKTKIAESVGGELAKKALAKKIKSVIFDRNGFAYHGRVKALADGAREGGLKF